MLATRVDGSTSAPLATVGAMREGGRRSSWLPLLLIIAVVAAGVPLIALNVPLMMSVASESKPRASRALRARAALPQPEEEQPLEMAVSTVARDVAMAPSELEGVGHALGAIDAVRKAVAALPAFAKTSQSLVTDLNHTRRELSDTTARLAAAVASLDRLQQQVGALQEPWAGHSGERLCASGHRCASYIDAGKTNLTALMSVAACRDHCARAFPATNFFAFHNEYGWIAFMLDPKGRCRCFEASPCEIVPDGGYNLWTSAKRCSVDLLDPSKRTAAVEAAASTTV